MHWVSLQRSGLLGAERAAVIGCSLAPGSFACPIRRWRRRGRLLRGAALTRIRWMCPGSKPVSCLPASALAALWGRGR